MLCKELLYRLQPLLRNLQSELNQRERFNRIVTYLILHKYQLLNNLKDQYQYQSQSQYKSQKLKQRSQLLARIARRLQAQRWLW